MDLKHLVTHFAYKVEPKPEGGFIARSIDPAVPPLEAPTREDLQQKIQQNILDALSVEFPGLKRPPDGKKLELAFHVERAPGGGFSIHSADPKAGIMQTSDPKEFESRFLEKFLAFAGKHLVPELSQALAAQVGTASIKVVVSSKTSLKMKADPKGMTFGTSNSPSIDQSATIDIAKLSHATPSFDKLDGAIANNPITPEPSNAGKVFGLLIAILILFGLTYLYLHYR